MNFYLGESGETSLDDTNSLMSLLHYFLDVGCCFQVVGYGHTKVFLCRFLFQVVAIQGISIFQAFTDFQYATLCFVEFEKPFLRRCNQMV